MIFPPAGDLPCRRGIPGQMNFLARHRPEAFLQNRIQRRESRSMIQDLRGRLHFVIHLQPGNGMALIAADHQFLSLALQAVSLLAVCLDDFHQHRKRQIKHRTAKRIVEFVNQLLYADPALTVHGNMNHLRVMPEDLADSPAQPVLTAFQHLPVLVRQMGKRACLRNKFTVVDHCRFPPLSLSVCNPSAV